MSKLRVACSFTGGKDCCLALHLLAERHPDAEVALLVVFAPKGGATSFKAHPVELIKLQAEAIGLPLQVVEISAEPTYLDGYRAALTSLRDQHGINALATGDILDVCDNFMVKAADGIMQLLRPLWGVPRRELLDLMWERSIEPIISCVNLDKFDTSSAAAAGDGSSGQGQERHCEVPGRCHGTGATATAAESTATGDAAAEGTASGYAPAGSTVTGDAFTAGSAASGSSTAVADGQAASLAPSSSDGRVDPVQGILGHVLSRGFHASVLARVCDERGVDECGERGEFHTMVLAAPALFRGRRVQLGASERQREGAFAFLRVQDVQLVAA